MRVWERVCEHACLQSGEGESARVDGEREGTECVLTRECARDRCVPVEQACL